MNFLYAIIISPIETIVDWVFLFIINKIESLGVIGAVVGVSLAINFLALPLYNIADALQEKERNIARKMEPRIKRIKKAFKGDEQFMMLQTYYRQQHYHPLYTLRSSLSILIEIPFFIAAYHYLSHNQALIGSSWWIFKDLGAPDTFFSLKIGGFSLGVHILPILMTLINFISAFIYTRNTPIRERVQVFALGIIFLVLLYNSPSGLVIYWILNNLFSLAKNIVLKLPHPKRILHAFISAICLLFAFYVLIHHGSMAKKGAILLFSLFVASLPLINRVFSSIVKKSGAKTDFIKPNYSFILSCALALALLLGFMLPARVIATSPLEFSFLGKTSSPLSYILTSFFVFFGFFVFYPTAIYKMFGEKVRSALCVVLFTLFLCAILNVFVFNYSYGNLSVSFTLDDEKVLKNFSPFFTFLPLIAVLFSVLLYYFCARFKKISVLSLLIFSIAAAEAFFGFSKTNQINTAYKHHSQNIAKYKLAKNDENEGIEKIYHLSKTQKNVIVLFLDRAISAFFPEVLEKKPELKKSFEGFTYYPNTLSFSTHTSLGSPAMMGGYEYTPSKMNERSDELLRVKHNEAMLVLPRLFSESGFNAVVSDPPWSNYAHEGDLSPFEEWPKIKAYTTFGKYTNKFFDKIGIRGGVSTDNADIICKKEIRNFSVLQSLYPPLRSTFYRLCRENSARDDRTYYNIFSSLYFLSDETDFSSENGTYCFIDNDTPHEPHSMNDDFLTISDKKKSREKTHFDSNCAALIQAAKYFDFLKKNGVWDNTRIIIVADHGQDLNLARFSDFDAPNEPAKYNPLLLFKDFAESGEVKTDYSFMTNADTLFLAKKDLPLKNENPFTHKTFLEEKSSGITLYPLSNGEHHADHLLNKTQFTLDKSRAWVVKENMLLSENWKRLLED